MLILVSGGAGSGKSEFAESLVCASPGSPRIYLATLELRDPESLERIRRHRALRAGKRFVTLECPRGLEAVSVPEGSTVLLEDLGNLCANECFGPLGFSGALERMEAGLVRLTERADLTVAVTNELFSDGVDYPAPTERYLALLAQLNRRAAAMAEKVYEVVCGIPVAWKGGAS